MKNQKVFWNNVHVWGQFDTIHQKAPREPCTSFPFPFFKDVLLVFIIQKVLSHTLLHKFFLENDTL